MKKLTRRVLSLALALCLVASMAVMASAVDDRRSGTNYGTYDSLTTSSYYSETGSSTDYYLGASVTYYYKTASGGEFEGGTVYANYQKNFTSISGSSNLVLTKSVSKHTVNYVVVETVTLSL